MNKIFKAYKDTILDEGISSFRYKFPKDKEQQLFDFYTLVSLPLWGLSGNQQMGQAEHQDIEEYKTAAEEAQNIIVNGLKDQQLKDVMFSVAAEFRHLFAYNTTEEILAFFKKTGNESFIKKYAVNYKLRDVGAKDYMDRVDKIRTEFDSSDKRGYLNSYKAILSTKISPENFMKLASAAFTGLKWANSYGGAPWANICEGWLKLNNANNYNDKTVWIDHVFDLQHNTDTVFNKIAEYSKMGGYSWIKKALDKKRNAKSLYEFWNDISGDLKYFTARLVKAATGETYEQWAKKQNVDANVNVSSRPTNYNAKPLNTVSYNAPDPIKIINSNSTIKVYKDGLTIDIIKSKFPWILDAKFKDAIIGYSKTDNYLIWYNGKWINGTWKAGTWLDGTWVKGTWQDGFWLKGTWQDGIWQGGTWYDGTWIKGSWVKGIWKDGTWETGFWKDGTWVKGTWQDGFWLKGTWQDGIWVKGTWQDGIWEGGTWYDGKWYNGTWEGGTWKDGTWNSKKNHPNSKNESINDKLSNQFLKLYEELSTVLQEQVICEAEISIYNLRKLLNTILVNSKSPETKTTLKEMLKVLTKLELGSLPIPVIRKVSDNTIEL